MKIQLKIKSQLECLKSIRKPVLPAPRAFKSLKDYKRSNWKRDLE